MRFPLSLSQAEQSQLSQPFPAGEVLPSRNHLHGPLLNCLQYIHVSLVLGSPELDQLQCGLTSAERRGRIATIDSLEMVCVM